MFTTLADFDFRWGVVYTSLTGVTTIITRRTRSKYCIACTDGFRRRRRSHIAQVHISFMHITPGTISYQVSYIYHTF